MSFDATPGVLLAYESASQLCPGFGPTAWGSHNQAIAQCWDPSGCELGGGGWVDFSGFPKNFAHSAP